MRRRSRLPLIDTKRNAIAWSDGILRRHLRVAGRFGRGGIARLSERLQCGEVGNAEEHRDIVVVAVPEDRSARTSSRNHRFARRQRLTIPIRVAHPNAIHPWRHTSGTHPLRTDPLALLRLALLRLPLLYSKAGRKVEQCVCTLSVPFSKILSVGLSLRAFRIAANGAIWDSCRGVGRHFQPALQVQKNANSFSAKTFGIQFFSHVIWIHPRIFSESDRTSSAAHPGARRSHGNAAAGPQALGGGGTRRAVRGALEGSESIPGHPLPDAPRRRNGGTPQVL